MKIKTKESTYDRVMAMEPYRGRRPKKQGKFWRRILKAASAGELRQVGFTCRKIGMERLAEDEPCLILMNHSSFIDLKIASTVLYPRQFHIVCTLDGFVGKEGLLRRVGCIPTRKFMMDTTLVRDMMYAVSELKSSILLYPEASYSFDGTATPLPESVGKIIKMLRVPVVMIRTYGAFARDPLYNGLRIRDVKVSADMEYLLSAEDAERLSKEEINRIVGERFSFDNWRWQSGSGIRITEDFRAEGLERVLYKCPACGAEGAMRGAGTKISCAACGKEYELTGPGELTACGGSTEFEFVSDWYAWEREEVKREIEAGKYELRLDVDIIALVNTDAVYRIGSGVLTHNADGFRLTGCGGKLDFRLSPEESYSLYADYFWYEIGDMISIGSKRVQYYCFPKEAGANVAKARLACEELYKRSKR